MKIRLHSDDYGYKPDADAHIRELIKNREIKSVSIISSMLRGKSLDTLPQLLSTTPQSSFGLHVNIVEGKSVSTRSEIYSLVDKKGRFYPFWLLFIRLICGFVRFDDAAKEIDRQIMKLKFLGVPLSFIDSHQHIHALSPFGEIIRNAAIRHKIPVIRSYKKIKNLTLQAKAIYFLLKILAVLSHYRFYKKFALPASWHIDSTTNVSFLSWEGIRMDIRKKSASNITFVIHPSLGFDTNTSYIPLLSQKPETLYSP